MIIIDLLKNHSETIPQLASIWYEVLGKIWIPDIPMDDVIQRFSKHLNDESLPLTFVAFDQNKPVGMCSLRENDGIRPDLTPWLGSLVIDTKYQRQGIGKSLINISKDKAKNMGYTKLYLFAIDSSIPNYYSNLGWSKIGIDELKGYPVTLMSVKL